ncbi:MAG: DUF3347 domain-containing protein [Chitinophagaceae bacterium]
MKNIFLGGAVCVLLLSACNNGTSQQASKSNTASAANTSISNNSPVGGIIIAYLQLKNALAVDNGKDASAAGAEILTALLKTDTASMNATQRKSYTDLSGDIRENAEHIRDNAGKIAHQREHFEMLSKDVEDLAKALGSGQTLYKDFCPMANDGKGAYWLSEQKEIKNPYYGDEMPDCGEVRDTIKQ